MNVQPHITALRQHFLRNPLLNSAIIGSTSLFLGWAFHDYQQFKRLGPGGVPYNLLGWLMVTLILRPMSMRKRDAVKTDDYELKDGQVSQAIRDLPVRRGPRAVVAGIIPHRQMSDNAPERMRKPLEELFFKTIIERNPTILETKLSHYEKHNPALYVHRSLMTSSTPPPVPEVAIVSQGEIGHVHPDLSIHLYFSEADAKVIMEKGWGERHRLARKTPWWVPAGRKYVLGVAPTYILVSGPRDEGEFQVVRALLKASAEFMTGGRMVVLE